MFAYNRIANNFNNCILTLTKTGEKKGEDLFTAIK